MKNFIIKLEDESGDVLENLGYFENFNDANEEFNNYIDSDFLIEKAQELYEENEDNIDMSLFIVVYQYMPQVKRYKEKLSQGAFIRDLLDLNEDEY